MNFHWENLAKIYKYPIWPIVYMYIEVIFGLKPGYLAKTQYMCTGHIPDIVGLSQNSDSR